MLVEHRKYSIIMLLYLAAAHLKKYRLPLISIHVTCVIHGAFGFGYNFKMV